MEEGIELKGAWMRKSYQELSKQDTLVVDYDARKGREYDLSKDLQRRGALVYRYSHNGH
jgi:hypothetical protein